MNDAVTVLAHRIDADAWDPVVETSDARWLSAALLLRSCDSIWIQRERFAIWVQVGDLDLDTVRDRAERYVPVGWLWHVDTDAPPQHPKAPVRP